ncbi:MAG: DUF3290 family protein [Liquorilactobacillus nagelii]|jgi:cell division protein FtsW (lipid II flippase)|uniref:DUF3290 family protein n=1 Tax=Liquorilactobacillus TaxID=2767888 RepID=UPI0006F0E6C6|nr:DUF3290 family protein [Liquorilactobacillus nagelii]KRL42375.1 hypothetical protein FD45_GL001148 [Liquorilactobacillus nagelii DSM 13675]MCI1634152.1 DUF3290 domain-containing protein [Liquorilactobacillus nagelii]MCI1921409.1 DUF3290 domain-containing protein [Liquorilactobacillus nagelii]MCI1977996.1 DUF3290 domain-containing protein [Liquorilactobacillus nagelii]QYH53230.1 DUF3290 domain-containing protein [Liquorilactobacillus nagelii DSM 13675]
MNFYSYKYLIQQNNQQNLFYIVSAGVVALIVIVMGWLWWRHRTEMKYRDLFVIMMLLLLLIIGSQVNEWQSVKNDFNQKSQIIQIMQRIAKVKHVKKNQVWSNTTDLTDGMLVMINHQIYRVTINDSGSNFSLMQVTLTSNSIKYIKTEK